jgi:site-specific DNA-methyltransferase (cytosine-N4-specific)
MPKWKPNAKAFPVAVNYSDVRGYQTTVPKPVMEVLGSPPKITFRIFRGRVVVEAGDSTVIPTPHGNGLDRFSEPPPTGPAYPLYRFDGQPVAATAMVGDPVAGEVHGEWGFKDADTKELTHGIHPYPARLIPQVARKLLLTYARPKAMVWDPFCGSGTVLLESMTHDHPSVGTDLNPFACLLARAKTTVILAPQLAKWSDMIAARLRSKGVEEALKRYQPNLSDFTLEVDKWWKPTVVRDLGFIRDQIAQVPGISRNTALAALLDVAFSRTVRDVSNQRPNEFKRYRRPEDELKDFTPDPISVFLTRWSETIAAVTRLTPAYDGAPRPEIVSVDCATYSPREEIGLILTSPPYGDSTTTVAYGQYSSLMMEWLPDLKADWREIDKRSLGGNPRSTRTKSHSESLKEVLDRIEKKDPERAKSVEAFFGDMRACLRNFYKALAPEACACLVIGDRTVSGVTVPNAKIITEDGTDLGFHHVQTLSRRIFFKVMPYRVNPVGRSGVDQDSPAISREQMVVLSRPHY